MTTTAGSHLLKSRPVAGLLGLSLLSLGLVLGGCAGDDSGTGETETETGDTTDNPTTTSASATESGASATENGSETETDTATDTDTETGESETSALEVSYAADIEPIWGMSCVLGCHTEGGANPQLLLGEGESYGNIVGVMSTQADMMLVEPGDSNASYLWHKLSNTHLEVGGMGTRMPLTPLSEELLAQIQAWIDGGAEND